MAKRARRVDTSKGLSRAAYGRHRKQKGLRGCTPAAVQKAIDERRISLNEHGKIDPAIADREWDANTRKYDLGDDASPTDESPKRVKERYEAEIKRLEFQRMDGSLVDREQVVLEGFDLARKVRSKLLALPERLAPIYASMGKPRSIARHLENELIQALVELAGDPDA